MLPRLLVMQTSACAHAQLSAPKFCYRPTMFEHTALKRGWSLGMMRARATKGRSVANDRLM